MFLSWKQIRQNEKSTIRKRLKYYLIWVLWNILKGYKRGSWLSITEYFKLANKHIFMTHHNSRFKVPQLHKIWSAMNAQIFFQMTLTSSVMLYFYLFSQVSVSCLASATLILTAVPTEPCLILLRPLLQNLNTTLNCTSALHYANSPVPNKPHIVSTP